MIFNSFEFVVFFAIVYPLYLALGRRAQNVVLLAASYVFYGWWDWRFLSLIWISTALDYACGLGLARSESPFRRRLLLGLSLTGNLGMLAVFKYFGFFADSLAVALEAAGLPAPQWGLRVVLPVGISFYTFQTLSYTFDVYRRRIGATRSLLDFALFVAFFPQLVAGPIERASHLLPQMARPRRIRSGEAHDGAWLVLWGLFKKVFIADNAALIVDRVYADPSAWGAPMLLIATYAFAVQIYCDFSGYSDIARGLGKLMGFDIRINFNLPYFARNPQDFWRRWHISLSEWIRDYLYIPLGGNRGTSGRIFFTLVITMGLAGLWHGAAWNFVLWGLFHAALIAAYRFFNGRRPAERREPQGLHVVWSVLLMFHWTCLSWVLFRADSLADVGGVLQGLAGRWRTDPGTGGAALALLGYAAPLLAVQALQVARRDLLAVRRLPGAVRFAVYVLLYFALTVGGNFAGQQFIYFQF